MYLHIIPTASSTKVVNSSYFRSKADAASTVDTPGHDCFYQWSNIFIFHSPTVQTQMGQMCKNSWLITYQPFFFFSYTQKRPSLRYIFTY